MSPEKELRLVLIGFELFLTLMFVVLGGFSLYHGAILSAIGCLAIAFMGAILSALMLKTEFNL